MGQLIIGLEASQLTIPMGCPIFNKYSHSTWGSQTSLFKIIKSIIVIIICLSLIIFGLINLQSQPCKCPQPEISSLSANELFYFINQHRVQNGKKTFLIDSKLCQFAEKRAKQIVTDFSHNGLYDNEYLKYFKNMGECLAKNFKNDEEVFKSWMNSSDHKKFIESDDYRYACIAYYLEDGKLYIALEMGR